MIKCGLPKANNKGQRKDAKKTEKAQKAEKPPEKERALIEYAT